MATMDGMPDEKAEGAKPPHKRPVAGGGEDGRPTLPKRSTDETDIGWGDEPDRDDDSRLLRDRPPHWDDA
jgi:hypothetical protein